MKTTIAVDTTVAVEVVATTAEAVVEVTTEVVAEATTEGVIGHKVVTTGTTTTVDATIEAVVMAADAMTDATPVSGTITTVDADVILTEEVEIASIKRTTDLTPATGNKSGFGKNNHKIKVGIAGLFC